MAAKGVSYDNCLRTFFNNLIFIWKEKYLNRALGANTRCRNAFIFDTLLCDSLSLTKQSIIYITFITMVSPLPNYPSSELFWSIRFPILSMDQKQTFFSQRLSIDFRQNARP